MKEIISMSANFLAAWSDEKKLIPRVEIILITSEPKYGIDMTGETTRQRVTDQYRFTSSPGALRELAKRLQGLADEVEELPLSNVSRQESMPETSAVATEWDESK